MDRDLKEIISKLSQLRRYLIENGYLRKNWINPTKLNTKINLRLIIKISVT